MTQTLDQLSAAATQGELHHCGWGDGSTQMGMTNIFNEHSEVMLVECIPEPDAAFIVALWNAFRTGQLVAVADDAIERVAELQLAAFLAGRGSVTSMKHGTRSAKPAPTMEQFRQMAIAAMKDTQP